ncbi:MFS transporter [Neolewinella aurantiaca]|uniref:MFS transporter n=1 Tax=Neolewinella aurantiaca TaxID=2602767 RepID=A0A5C7FJ56_9BACT|nr:MFS transporter [Neolewinella aurantiaca]TXF91232.1 MFS transporter [Neolewinella aurantiaca]
MKSTVLPVIVLAQFCCTSVWFAGNAVLTELIETFGLPTSALSGLTSAVQFGFICGTLVFAMLAIADRFSPSRVFCVSALAAALCNFCATLDANTFATLLGGRFLTGFFLAGIYPVGMKIAADYFQKGLGRSLGFLVGALVLGTAFPHLVKAVGGALPWKAILYCTSAFAAAGGLMILGLVPDGPYRVSGSRPKFTAFIRVFRNGPFRAAALGYFGHMWELYTFWAFIPVWLAAYFSGQILPVNISLLTFLVIASGGLACVLAGYLSGAFGVKRVAALALAVSGGCCLISPLVFGASPFLFLPFLFVWGMTVVADSPLFSTLVAESAEQEVKGTALTIVNCLGYATTIVSLQLLSGTDGWLDARWLFLLLAPGPLLGLFGLFYGGAAGAKRV